MLAIPWRRLFLAAFGIILVVAAVLRDRLLWSWALCLNHNKEDYYYYITPFLSPCSTGNRPLDSIQFRLCCRCHCPSAVPEARRPHFILQICFLVMPWLSPTLRPGGVRYTPRPTTDQNLRSRLSRNELKLCRNRQLTAFVQQCLFMYMLARRLDTPRSSSIRHCQVAIVSAEQIVAVTRSFCSEKKRNSDQPDIAMFNQLHEYYVNSFVRYTQR